MTRKVLRGFTVVEMLIVITIILILATLLGGVLLMQLDRAKNSAQADHIRKILAATEQFKNDFREYPAVDATTNAGAQIGAVDTTSPEWAEHNSLAFRLCQGINGVQTTTFDRSKRGTWAGSYLTAEDVAQDLLRNHSTPTSATNKTEMLDLWGNPLAYCMTTSVFLKGVADRATFSGATVHSNYNTGWATSPATTLSTGDNYTIGAGTFYGKVYKKNDIYYARPGTTAVANGFMGPVSYALNDNWIDAEMNMPEIWSQGKDGLYKKLQYNKSHTSFDEANDKDNVGGNLNVMKVQ